MTDADKELYFKDGYQARREGYPEGCNPHLPDSVEYDQWRQGWRNRNVFLAKKAAEGRNKHFLTKGKKPGER